MTPCALGPRRSAAGASLQRRRTVRTIETTEAIDCRGRKQKRVTPLIKPLVAVLGLALAGTGAATGVYLALPGGGEQEVAQQVQATSTASAAKSTAPATPTTTGPTPTPKV